MKNEDVNKLSLGLYTVVWKDGGKSLAAVGNLPNGQRWIMPCNWVSFPKDIEMTWEMVKYVKLIQEA